MENEIKVLGTNYKIFFKNAEDDKMYNLVIKYLNKEIGDK